jgi:exopolysaccharide biosynthesis polyprenyl glycosylphosphotransferase
VLIITTGGSWSTKLVRGLGSGVALTLLMLLVLAAHKLYRARACTIRAAEVAAIGRSAAICAVAAVLLGRAVSGGPSVPAALLGATVSFVVIAYLRGGYSNRLRAYRARGLLTRPVCILGVNDEAEGLVRLLEDQPELGFRVIAMLGDPVTWDRRGLDIPAVHSAGDPAGSARSLGASGVIVAVTSIERPELDRVVRQLLASGLHVQISTGLARVGHQRLRASPLSHQPLFYVEPPKFAAWQLGLKRAIDITFTLLGLLLLAPVLAALAVAIKLNDGGPVFYRQTRVGFNGRLFQVIKLRTMVPDASSQLAQLVGANERNGPLFKLSDDPRVTRVGRVLRSTSLDELPQLFNVLRGDMSLVGPRPALPNEVAEFDEELLERTSVPPGITGLWQVEARDNPSFDAYRRLDLFYVDNWSVTMDLAILLTTVGVVLGRAARGLRTGREDLNVVSRRVPRLESAATPIIPSTAPLDTPGVYTG